MPVIHLRRLFALLGGSAFLLLALPASAAPLPGAPPATAPVMASGPHYSEAELRLIHEEAAATGGATYTFYILGSEDRDVIQDTWAQLQDPRAQHLSMKTLLKMAPVQQQAFALPLPVREQLRQLNPGERSAIFALGKRSWGIVELEAINTSTPVPAFESLHNALPKLVSTGAIPEPRVLATTPALVQRSLMNKALTTTAFDLLPPGFDIDMPLSNGFTLLQRALARDDAAMVTATLKRAANANLCLVRSCPLLIAVRSQTRAAPYVAELLAAGAKPDQVSAPGEYTPLTVASATGNLESVRQLLQARADRNGADDPNTPLGAALYMNHLAVAQLLLDKGADPLLRKPLKGGGFATPMGSALDSQKPETVAWLRAAIRKHVATRKPWRWSFWLEQDGVKIPVAGGRAHLKRKPFTLHVRLPAGGELRLEATTSPRLFDEHKANDLRAPLYQLSRLYSELHDGSAKALLVSDHAARAADPAKRGGIQAWQWSESRKDFNRIDKTPQGPVVVREINALVVDDGHGKTEVALEKSRLREISLVVGTGLDYAPAIGDYANAKRLRLVFDR